MYKKLIYSTFFSFMFCLILTTSSSAADPSLVGWWKLDETSGLIATDISGSGNDGTLMNMGGEEWTTGVINGALDMDGTDDYVDLGNNPRRFTLLGVLAFAPNFFHQSVKQGKGGLQQPVQF